MSPFVVKLYQFFKSFNFSSKVFGEEWGDWDSVTCFACGLASIDPEVR